MPNTSIQLPNQTDLLELISFLGASPGKKAKIIEHDSSDAEKIRTDSPSNETNKGNEFLCTFHQIDSGLF